MGCPSLMFVHILGPGPQQVIYLTTSYSGQSRGLSNPVLPRAGASVPLLTMRLRATTIATVFLHLCHAAHDRRTFALLQFNGPEIVRGRIDPIVFPGRVSEHVHGVMGGSAFAADATGESMARSTCTNAKAADDKSAYWFPWLYFHDPITRRFEPVDIGYVNVYYL